jgi:hypothetical protein
MVDDTTRQETDLDDVADRLEAALDLIVRHLDAAKPTAELAERLDRLILRLRDALSHAAE